MFLQSPAGATNQKSKLGLLVVLFAYAVYLGNVNRFHLERWDDAYISFRFAKHLAQGQGLIWNAGGAPVEGYTSFLHIFLLALTSAIDLDVRLASLLISILSVSTAVIIMIKLTGRQFGAISILPFFAVALYLVDPVTAVHSASGLETQLFVAVLAANLYFAFSFVETTGWRAAAGIALSTIAACLCRPEGAIYGAAIYLALMIFVFSAFEKDAGAKEKAAKLFASMALTIVLGSIYAFWKYRYFGYLLPNPYYVKSGKLALAGVAEVADYIVHLAKWFAPPAAIFLLFVYQLSRKNKDIQDEIIGNLRQRLSDLKIRAKIALMIFPPVSALLYYSTIIHEVGGSFRFSYPTYFYFALLLAAFLGVLFVSAQKLKSLRAGMVTISLLWLAFLIIWQKSWLITPVPPSSFNNYHFQIAEALAETKLGNQGIIMCDAAGIIPFVSGFNQIDRVGLVDNYLSGRSNPSLTERESYFWSQPADVYIGYEPPAATGSDRAADDRVMRSPYVSEILLKRKLSLVESRIFVQDAELLYSRLRRLRDDWILVGELNFPGWRAWRLKSFVYVRRASPHAPVLTGKLQKIVKLKPEQIRLDDSGAQ